MEEWQAIQGLLTTYEKASGQGINKLKTKIFFSSNTNLIAITQLLASVGVSLYSSHEKYLNLPIIVGKNRSRAFKGVRDKVWARVNNWKNNFLSPTGKEVLLKSIRQAIRTYAMSMFLLPRKICKDIASSMSNFWWGRMHKEKGIYQRKWKLLGDTKSQVGLGFRDLEAFNKAFYAKQIWRLIQNPTFLTSQNLKEKYFPHPSVLAAKKGHNPSLIW